MSKDWLDSWCDTRRLSDEPPKPMSLPDEPATAKPLADSLYILKHGKKAYREWLKEGRPKCG